MEKNTIEYGTQHKCKVLSATDKIITVLGDDGEGYILVGHEIKDLPKKGDNGKITFVKSDTPFNGHWNYEGVKN